MTFILMVYLYAGYSGVAVTAEFSSKQNCETALAYWSTKVSKGETVGVCLPK